MAETTTADLIIPEVWADAVAPVILGKTVWAQLADTDDQLVGQPGDSVTFPKFNYIGDADTLTEGVAMDTTKLTMTDSKATIEEAGKAVELTDSATLSALGQPDSQAQQQLAISVARKIDTRLREAALYTHTNGGAGDTEPTTAPLTVTTTAARLNWAALVAGTMLLGDEYDPSELKGIVIHSKQYADLLLDPLFLDANKGGNGAILRGQIGQIGGIPVLVSDRGTTTGTGADTVYTAVIVRNGGLALKYKRRPIVEKDRDILKRTNIVTTNVHFAVKRTDDRGVIVIKTKAVGA